MVEIIRHALGSVDSTNSWAKSHLSELARGRLHLITADEQVAGRGQFGRPWVSPPGCNLYATFAFFLEKGREDLHLLAQLLALSGAKVLRELGLHVTIKWPNDLLIGGRKIAGILVEVVDLQEVFGIAAGIGLNVNATERELKAVGREATSIFLEQGVEIERDQLLDSLETTFSRDLTIFIQSSKKFMDEIKEFEITNNSSAS